MSISFYDKMVWAARLAAVLPPVVAVVYGLSLVLAATIWHGSVPVGSFQGMTLILFPVALLVAFPGWKWPLVGGGWCSVRYKWIPGKTYMIGDGPSLNPIMPSPRFRLDSRFRGNDAFFLVLDFGFDF
jgi:hypothetical protein